MSHSPVLSSDVLSPEVSEQICSWKAPRVFNVLKYHLLGDDPEHFPTQFFSVYQPTLLQIAQSPQALSEAESIEFAQISIEVLREIVRVFPPGSVEPDIRLLLINGIASPLESILPKLDKNVALGIFRQFDEIIFSEDALLSQDSLDYPQLNQLTPHVLELYRYGIDELLLIEFDKKEAFRNSIRYQMLPNTLRMRELLEYNSNEESLQRILPEFGRNDERVASTSLAGICINSSYSKQTRQSALAKLAFSSKPVFEGVIAVLDSLEQGILQGMRSGNFLINRLSPSEKDSDSWKVERHVHYLMASLAVSTKAFPTLSSNWIDSLLNYRDELTTCFARYFSHQAYLSPRRSFDLWNLISQFGTDPRGQGDQNRSAFCLTHSNSCVQDIGSCLASAAEFVAESNSHRARGPKILAEALGSLDIQLDGCALEAATQYTLRDNSEGPKRDRILEVLLEVAGLERGPDLIENNIHLIQDPVVRARVLGRSLLPIAPQSAISLSRDIFSPEGNLTAKNAFLSAASTADLGILGRFELESIVLPCITQRYKTLNGSYIDQFFRDGLYDAYAKLSQELVLDFDDYTIDKIDALASAVLDAAFCNSDSRQEKEHKAKAIIDKYFEKDSNLLEYFVLRNIFKRGILNSDKIFDIAMEIIDECQESKRDRCKARASVLLGESYCFDKLSPPSSKLIPKDDRSILPKADRWFSLDACATRLEGKALDYHAGVAHEIARILNKAGMSGLLLTCLHSLESSISESKQRQSDPKSMEKAELVAGWIREVAILT